MEIIEIKGITKDYGKGKGVFDLSFSVKKGETLGFLGPNGAGKTTTIRQLMGFIRPGKGSVQILGMDCFKQAKEIQRHVGYLPGEIAFPDSISGMNFIRFLAGMKGMENLGRANELMERFKLDPSGKIARMSKGMKQKVGIVCAFMQDPDILILDEPTSGLDPLMQNVFVELIQEEKQKGKTILMSSHIFEETERTCDRAAILRKGRLVELKGMESLKQSRKKSYRLQFVNIPEAENFVKEYPQAQRQGTTVQLTVGGETDKLIKAVSKYTIEDLSTSTQSLEELFMGYYGEGSESGND